MSATAIACPHTGTVPWRAARMPAGVDRVAHVIFGMQAPTPAAGARHRARLLELLALEHGPGALEHGSYIDPQGFHCDLYLAYWLHDSEFHAWWEAHGEDWWQALPQDDSAPGFWREVMTPPPTRFQYGAGNDDVAGLVRLCGVEPSTKFGYWGGYRDRIPASATDKFLSPLERIPEPVARNTRGRRLRVITPDNLCYLREGQAWDKAGAEERAVWREQMEQTVENWVATLRDEPARTGCLSVRFCRERDVKTGQPLEKQSQAVFALSLHHIERAARTVATHLAVKDTFTRMHAEARFVPRMHIWVEMFILKAADFVGEYVNCHPQTGLLPYFEAVEIA